MPTGLNTRWEFGTDMQIFMARHNRTRKFENKVMCFLTRKHDQNANFRVLFTSSKHDKIDCFIVNGYFDHSRTVFEAMAYSYSNTSVLVKRLVPPEQNRILMEETRRERWKIWDGKIQKRNDTKLKKSGNVSSEKVSKPMTRSKFLPEIFCPTRNLILRTSI